MTCSCSSSGFPCVGVSLIYWSLRSTGSMATFVICFHWPLLLAFSLHFSSSSAFLRSLFTQSSHLSCCLPRFLEPSCCFVLALFGSLSSFIRTMCPSHFFRLLLTILPTILELYFQLLLAGLSFSVSPLSLLRLFSLSSCSHILVVYVDAVRIELTSPTRTSWHHTGIQDLPLQFSGNLSVHHYPIYVSPCIRSCLYSASNLHIHTPVLRYISTKTHNIIYLLNVFPVPAWCLAPLSVFQPTSLLSFL